MGMGDDGVCVGAGRWVRTMGCRDERWCELWDSAIGGGWVMTGRGWCVWVGMR